MGHGGMSCAMKSVRCVMVLFNILFFLIGALFLALGIYVMVDPRLQKIKEFVRIDSTPGIEKGLSYLEVLAIVLIVLGSILLIIGFLGCCGAMKQVKLFLTCYAIIIAIIIIVEVAFTIYFVVFQSKFKDQFVPKLTDSLQATYEGPLGLTAYGNKKPSPVSLAWDFIMYNFKCCGVQKPEDFYAAKAWNRTNPWQMTSPSPFSVPLTCCSAISGEQNWNDLPLDKLKAAEACAVTGVGHPDLYKTGCYNKLVDLLDSAKIWVIVIAVVILVIELLAFIFTLALCCRQRKDTIYYSS